MNRLNRLANESAEKMAAIATSDQGKGVVLKVDE